MTPLTTDDLIARHGVAYKWYATATVMVGCIATVLSATIVNVALPDIMGEFGMGQDKAQWLSTAFLAAMTASMLVTAWLSASFGSRATYIAALLVFILGSVIGGISPNEDVLILARLLQGAAAGVIQPLTMVTVFQSFPPEKRGLAMGIFGMGVILAPALGPTLGGMLIDNYSWRYVFFMGPPFCLAGMLLAPAFLPNAVAAARRGFDLIGFVLLSLSIAAFLTGLSNGQRDGWDSAFIQSAFGVAAVGSVLFVIQEKRSPTPILALRVYLNPRFAAASVVAFILGLGLYGSTYLVPLFVQTIQGYSPTESGLLLMPAGVVLGVVFPLAGRMSDKIAPDRMICAGLFLFGLSSTLMMNLGTSTDFWDLALWVVVGRIGLGLILPSLNGGALRVLSPDMVGQGAGAINFIRQLGGAAGVSLLSVWLDRQTSFYAAEFNALQTGTPIANDTLNLIAMLLRRGGIPDTAPISLHTDLAYGFFSRMISAQANVMGFRESFLLVAGLFFLALLPAWFMRKRKEML